MRVLFIGGTGIISTASHATGRRARHRPDPADRGQRAADLPAGVHTLTADIDNAAAAARALGDAAFDAVVDWIAFTPAHMERDLAIFRGRTRQYHLHQLGQRLSEAAPATT